MNTTRDQQHERWVGLPDVLQNLSNENSIVHDIVHRYLAGHIVTREELFLQIISHQHVNWEKLNRDYIQYRSLVVDPIMIPRAESR